MRLKEIRERKGQRSERWKNTWWLWLNMHSECHFETKTRMELKRMGMMKFSWWIDKIFWYETRTHYMIWMKIHARKEKKRSEDKRTSVLTILSEDGHKGAVWDERREEWQNIYSGDFFSPIGIPGNWEMKEGANSHWFHCNVMAELIVNGK